jgi:nicotinate dehydrogenase subunit B
METRELTTTVDHATLTRKSFFKGTGMLVIGLSTSGTLAGSALAKSSKSSATPVYPTLDLGQLDSFLEVHGDGRVVGKAGKINVGLGTPTGLAMIIAEELDVPLASVSIKLGDTATTPDQGGSGSSNGINTGYTGTQTLRVAAATARQVLLGLASTKLGVPVASLSVTNGVVSGAGTGQTVSYAQLIGNQKFNAPLASTAPTKPTSAYKLIGTPQQRPEIRQIVTANMDWVGDIRLPGLLHGRSVRPPVMGSTLVSVDGPHKIPGLVKVVVQGNYVGVVAKTEWQAIQAANALKVTWKEPATPVLPSNSTELYDYLAKTPPYAVSTALNVGDVDGAIASAAKTLSATYHSAFQSHSSMGPGCAVADCSNGGAVVYYGGQKPYRTRLAIADQLGIPSLNVRVVWYPGPGSYGSNDADDVAAEAVALSKAVGQPVRLQWMRHEATAWDPKAPPHVTTMRAGIDANGKVVAVDYSARLLSGTQRAAGALIKGDTLIGQMSGSVPLNAAEHGTPADFYGFPNKRRVSNVVPSTQFYATGLRTAHLRDPNGPQVTFASESFIDEIANALKLDPINFRLTYLEPNAGARDIRVIQQVRAAANWESRPSPNPNAGTGTIVSGRGFAYQPRSGTYVATVAEVTVNRKTGEVKLTRFVSGQDTGLVVNPTGVKSAQEGNLIQSMSRALHEGVQFNSKTITSTDWVTYPTVDIKDIPEVKTILVAPDGIDPSGKFVPPSGSGEPTTRPTAAAIGNAIFDATGVRVREQPMTKAAVLNALKAAGKAIA